MVNRGSFMWTAYPRSGMLSTSIDHVDQKQLFSRWIRKELANRQWRQADLVERTSLSKSAISAYVTGHRVPDPKACDLIADALLIDLDLVLWQAGHRPNIEAVSPDDPRVIIIGLAERIDWTKPNRLEFIEPMLRKWADEDRRSKQ